MESDLQKKRKSAEDSALFDNVASEKLKETLIKSSHYAANMV